MKSITFKLIAMAVISITILAACLPAASIPTAKSNKQRATNPSAPVDGVKELVEGNNAFALELYNELRSEGGNPTAARVRQILPACSRETGTRV